ncbi:SpoIIE family protein phosphatase [Streptomyces sp. NPDC088816]|uniref:SpoIIE family protein phosphatase n=1 Tax=Streptomyces sp. NPDC088816 TaxID=3365906 RepID=UPI003814CE8D
MPRVWEVPVPDSTRVRDARVAAEEAAALAGLGESRTAAAALVATELATNLLKYAQDGRLLVEVVPPPRAPYGHGDPAPVVQMTAVDHGPGIADVAAARRDGFSTSGSLGAGLGTCRRAADEFHLHSVIGRGTVALARLGATVPRPGAVRAEEDDTLPYAGAVRAGGVTVPYAGAEYSGDAWSWAGAGDLVTLLLADGLGHGREAARASSAAVETLHRSARLTPTELLRRLDTALRGTRGAAVAVAQLDLRAGRLRFCGIGNVGARLREGDSWRHLLSRPGIVGVHRPTTLPETEVAWAPDRLLVLHSDGLPSRWAPPGAAALPTAADPAVTAALTVRDTGSSASPVRDDTTVAVLTSAPPDRP